MIECQFCHQINLNATNELERLETEVAASRVYIQELHDELKIERAKTLANHEPVEIMKVALDAIDGVTAGGTMHPKLVRAAAMLDSFIRKNRGWR